MFNTSHVFAQKVIPFQTLERTRFFQLSYDSDSYRYTRSLVTSHVGRERADRIFYNKCPIKSIYRYDGCVSLLGRGIITSCGYISFLVLFMDLKKERFMSTFTGFSHWKGH